MKNRITFLYATFLLIISVVVMGVVGVSFALFTDKDVSTINATAGTVEVELIETFPSSDEFGANTTGKTFSILSKGNKRTYVRASIYTTVEYYDSGNWIAYAVDQDNITYTINAPDWVYSNGYYYYKKILYLPAPNNQTSQFIITNVEVTPLPDELEGKQVRYNMSVKVEGSQATHEAYKRNFNISALPAGVETLS